LGKRFQGHAPFGCLGFAAKAPKGRNIKAMGEAHRNADANPSQALKGRNNQAKRKGRGAGIWPFITHEDNFAPSGLSFLGLAPLIITPLRGWANPEGDGIVIAY